MPPVLLAPSVQSSHQGMENHIPPLPGQPGAQTSLVVCAPGAPLVHIGTQNKVVAATVALTNINAVSATALNTAAITVPSDTPFESSLGSHPLPPHIVTHIKTSVLAQFLLSHPDRELVTYLLHGFHYGFDLMFARPIKSTSPRNLLSTVEHNQVVTHAIHSELLLGHISGPLRSPPFHICHCSPLGAVLKPSGHIRLILDLSQPRGTSVAS